MGILENARSVPGLKRVIQEDLADRVLLVTQSGRADDAVRRHYSGCWPRRRHVEFEWTLGPIGTRLQAFRVRQIAPRKRSESWVYVTVGAWQATDGADSKEVFDPRRGSLV